VGAGEITGLCELLLDMPTCMQTTRCLEDCQVFYILKSSYERLVLKRNPATVDKMKDHVYLKLKARNERLNAMQPVDLFRSIQYHIELFDRNRRTTSEMSGKACDSDLPTKGAVIQMDVASRPKSAAHFLTREQHRKQQQQQQQQQQQHTSRSYPTASSNSKKEDRLTSNKISLPKPTPPPQSLQVESEPDEAKNVEIIEEFADQIDEIKESVAKVASGGSLAGGGLNAGFVGGSFEQNTENEILENRIKSWHRELGHNKVFVAPLKDAEVNTDYLFYSASVYGILHFYVSESFSK
jgi:hypothetical protein